MIKVFAFDLDGTLTQHKTPLDFLQYFGIMCVTTRKEREMIDLKPYYQVKLTLLRCKTYFLNNPPKTENEKYAYDII